MLAQGPCDMVEGRIPPNGFSSHILLSCLTLALESDVMLPAEPLRARLRHST